jgi:hypothetical protein
MLHAWNKNMEEEFLARQLDIMSGLEHHVKVAKSICLYGDSKETMAM